MLSFEEETPKEEEEALQLLLRNSQKASTAPKKEVTLRIPRGMSEEEFLKAVKNLLTPKKADVPHCNTCIHEDPSDKHCKMQSCACATAVGNHRTPPWWLLKE